MSTLDQFSTASPGPQGPQGPVGNTGPVGATGPQGLQGPQGPQGPAGIQGIVGPQGIIGPQGDEGIQGPTGPAGTEVGPAGPTGPQGSEGAQGPRGPQGLQGIQGDAGPQGATGSQGPVGESPQGPYGPDGDQGPQGLVGDTGPKGPDGLPPAPLISDRTVSDFNTSPGTATAGIEFFTTGVLQLYRGNSANSNLASEWTSNQFTDIGDIYEIYITKLSGANLTVGGGLLGTWLPLTLARQFRLAVTTVTAFDSDNVQTVLSCTVRRTDLSASEQGNITLSVQMEGLE